MQQPADDRITALGSRTGGYHTKPFDRHKLLAHLKAIIGRANDHRSLQNSVGNTTIDVVNNPQTIHENLIALTQKEYQIAHLAGIRIGAILSKDAFISHTRGYSDKLVTKIIDFLICRLRRKLRSVGFQNAKIDTIWG